MKASHFILFETVLAATLGSVVSLLLSRWSQTLLDAIRQGARVARPLLLVQMFCGATTGTVAIRRSPDEAAIICVVAILLIVQLPLDLFARRLSRALTAGAFAVILTTLVFRTMFRNAGEEALKSLVLSAVIVGVFVGLHMLSPSSLGLGDVFLVAPLSFAVTSSSVFAGILWLAVSSGSGAFHGVVSLIRRRGKNLPFGPHLLVAAWSLLVVGV